MSFRGKFAIQSDQRHDTHHNQVRQQTQGWLLPNDQEIHFCSPLLVLCSRHLHTVARSVREKQLARTPRWLTTDQILPQDSLYSTTAPLFFYLPLELRVQIYEYLVVVGKVFYTPDVYSAQTELKFGAMDAYRKPSLHRFRVCRQIHKESRSGLRDKESVRSSISLQLQTPIL